MLVTEGNKIAHTVLARLKLATKALHAEIDAHLPLAARDAGRDDYLAHLRLLQTWLAAIAPPIARGADRLAEFAAVSNQTSLALLQRDLAAAGLAARPPQATLATLARHADIDQAAFRWGMQYVIEGSYMGAGVLHKRLAPQWPDCPMYFFGHVAAGNRARWAGFAEAIEQAVAGHAALARAEQGAIHAFAHFIECARVGDLSLSPSESE